MRALLLLLLLLPGEILAGCGHRSVAAPTADDSGTDGGPDARDGAIDSGEVDASTDSGEGAEWGGPCEEDRECQDEVPCTADRCEGNRCHFAPDDAACDDLVFCNGEEKCVPGIGCRSGEPLSCSDASSCTIDACDETTRRCVHAPRDGDGDGDPDGNCADGGDCNDNDPRVSSLEVEICGNAVDDDCDGRKDETGDCQHPAHDVCADPLEIRAPGSFSLSADAAALDVGASCFETGARWRDLVAAVHVPEGDPIDVDLVLTAMSGTVGLAAATECDNPSAEVACAAGAAPSGLRVARLRLRAPPPGVIAVYLFSDSTAPLTLSADFLPPIPAPTNETCGTAGRVPTDTHAIASLTGARQDLEPACGPPFADLVYEFELAEARDVDVFATSLDAYGMPLLSLREAACTEETAELTCRRADNAHLFRRSLPAGRYTLGVGATGPSAVDFVIETSAPSVPPPDESCAGAPSLEPNRTTPVDLHAHEDDVTLDCDAGMADAARALVLTEPSDVLGVLMVSGGDRGAIGITGATCSPDGDPFVCSIGEEMPVRTSAFGLPPGEYRVVVESQQGSPTSVTAFVRPASAPTLVPFSDGCADATEIPSVGGSFQGNTANVAHDFTASCDVGGSDPAPDQLLHLVLGEERRVVLDARGSAFSVIVDVRTGATCPGQEVVGGCSAGYVRGGSFIDLTLPAGEYWVQIDGYGGDSGAWLLDVFVASLP